MPKLLDFRLLLVGQDLGHHFVDADAACESLRRALIVTGRHDRMDRIPPKLSNRVGSFHWVRNNHETGPLPVDGDEHHALAMRSVLVRFRLECGSADAQLLALIALIIGFAMNRRPRNPTKA